MVGNDDYYLGYGRVSIVVYRASFSVRMLHPISISELPQFFAFSSGSCWVTSCTKSLLCARKLTRGATASHWTCRCPPAFDAYGDKEMPSRTQVGQDFGSIPVGSVQLRSHNGMPRHATQGFSLHLAKGERFGKNGPLMRRALDFIFVAFSIRLAAACHRCSHRSL